MTIKFYICFFLLGCALIVGCTSISSTAVVVTVTEGPSSTNTSSPLPTETVTRLPTATLAPVFTLDPQQAVAALKENNPNCLAPCFMGIIPSQTSLVEAKNLFGRLGLALELTSSEGNDEFYVASYKFESGSSFRVRLKVRFGVVQDLDIPVNLSQSQTGIVQQEWSTYSPDILIKKYGTPTKVNFFVDRGPTPSYAMDLYFDTADLIVEYYSYDLGPKLQICPLTDQMEFVRIWIGKEPINPHLDTIHLKDATSMTMEEFSKIMIGNPNKACFLLNSEAFP